MGLAQAEPLSSHACEVKTSSGFLLMRKWVDRMGTSCRALFCLSWASYFNKGPTEASIWQEPQAVRMKAVGIFQGSLCPHTWSLIYSVLHLTYECPALLLVWGTIYWVRKPNKLGSKVAHILMQNVASNTRRWQRYSHPVINLRPQHRSRARGSYSRWTPDDAVHSAVCTYLPAPSLCCTDKNAHPGRPRKVTKPSAGCGVPEDNRLVSKLKRAYDCELLLSAWWVGPANWSIFFNF